MKKFILYSVFAVIGLAVLSFAYFWLSQKGYINSRSADAGIIDSLLILNSDPYRNKDTHVIIPTFLGNPQRNYYGEDPPGKLNLLWKTFLGSGTTGFSSDKWYGAGWTGQPLLTMEFDTLYIYQGAFDHNLKKINASTGEIVWEYRFDDIIKGTGTIYKRSDGSFSIVQGSRRGKGISLTAKESFSLRSVSITTGLEEWRYNVEYTGSRSRDVDASPLVFGDTVYAVLENGLLVLLNSAKSEDHKSFKIPEEILSVELFPQKNHYGRKILESSPVLLGNTVYVATESGYVYGFDRRTKDISLGYYIGSDLDGTPSVASDSCLLIAVERQHIAGLGGVLKLDHSKENPEVWYFPVKNKSFESWQGGVIGSVSTYGKYCVFTGIEGTMYLVEHSALSGTKVKGPDGRKELPSPLLLDKFYIGPSISTPIIVGNKIIACSYAGIYLFEIDRENKLNLLDKVMNGFEATPVCFNKKIYIASRDGFLYCYGEE